MKKFRTLNLALSNYLVVGTDLYHIHNSSFKSTLVGINNLVYDSEGKLMDIIVSLKNEGVSGYVMQSISNYKPAVRPFEEIEYLMPGESKKRYIDHLHQKFLIGTDKNSRAKWFVDYSENRIRTIIDHSGKIVVDIWLKYPDRTALGQIHELMRLGFDVFGLEDHNLAYSFNDL